MHRSLPRLLVAAGLLAGGVAHATDAAPATPSAAAPATPAALPPAEAAAPAKPAAAEPASAPAPKPKLVCTHERPLGSNLVKRVCRTPEEIAEDRARVREMQRGSTRGTLEEPTIRR